MAEEWLQAVLQDFGKRLGMSQFRLNDKGAAGVVFENGVAFRVEYRSEKLFLCMTAPMADTPQNLKKILQAAHPAALQPGLPLHAAYHADRQRGFLMTAIADREISVPKLDQAFTLLWDNIRKI